MPVPNGPEAHWTRPRYAPLVPFSYLGGSRMFGLFEKSRPRPASTPKRRAMLMLERLEARYCLTAPPALTLSAQACPGHMVMLSGSVLDSQPGGVKVSFSGAAVGSVTTD